MAAPAPAPPSGGNPTAKLPVALMVKLSLMMFLQFFIWGAWFEIGFSYIPGLKFAEPWMNAMVFGAFNIGALVALFFSTQYADRKFAAQKFLAVSHLIGGLAIGGLFFLQTPVGTEKGNLNSVRVEDHSVSTPKDGVRVPALAKGVLVVNGEKMEVEIDSAVPTSEADFAELAPANEKRLDDYEAASAADRAKADKWKGLGAADKFWAAFDGDKAKFDAAKKKVDDLKDAGGDELKKATDELAKLKDPRFVTTFVITTKGEDGDLRGDAKKALAPFWPFFLLMLLHSVFYVPTISITNSIAFNAFTNPEKQFGPVRLWGTIGWIAASWPFIFILADWSGVGAKGGIEWLGAVLANSLTGAAAQDGKKSVFLVAGIASLVLAAFSLRLPHTPPKPATGGDSLAWLKAVKLLGNFPILILFVVTFIDAAVHQSYFVWTFDFLVKKVGIAENWAGAAMKIGQVAEIITMLALGWVLKSLGWKWTMVIGVLGHAIRFGVFAFFPEQPPVLLAIALHGVCYAFFFATVYIFVDKTFPKDARSSAQGLFNVLIVGVGPFVANFICGVLAGTAKTQDGSLSYPVVFQVSMLAALVGAALLAVFFNPKQKVGSGV